MYHWIAFKLHYNPPIGPGGGGCFGFTQWDKVSTYEAIIWDLIELTEKGRIRVDSEGTSYLIGVVAPLMVTMHGTMFGAMQGSKCILRRRSSDLPWRP